MRKHRHPSPRVWRSATFYTSQLIVDERTPNRPKRKRTRR